jgi:hypothetical protein
MFLLEESTQTHICHVSPWDNSSCTISVPACSDASSDAVSFTTNDD